MTPRSLLAPARLAGQPILRSQSDERLVDLVRAGYAPAFEAIVARYRHALLRYASRLLDNERAEDVVQQSFVKAYDAMVGGTSDLTLRPWLYRIAHNTALNALRDRGLRHEQLDETIDGVERPDQAFERSEGLRQVVASIKDLPPRQRDALLLQALEGRSYDEIARELGVSDGSVRQLLNRARTQLRAGVTAITPVGLLTRIPWQESGEPVAARIAELVAGAGAGALVTKVAATIAVTGAVAGGVASVEDPVSSSAKEEPAAQSAAPEREGPTSSRSARARTSTPARGPVAGQAGGGSRDDNSSGDDDRSGPGDGDIDNSGPGGGGETEDNSGLGGGGDTGDGDSSGPGSGEPTVTTAPTDNSGPGSANSGTGSSGSGGDSSGSGSSGSGDSGSGSSDLD